jgi:uncharacterized delta-60 repeat protein
MWFLCKLFDQVYCIGSGGDYACDVIADNSGRLIAVGTSYNGSNYDFSLARYTSNGTLDSSFGIGGKVITSLSTFTDYASSVLVDSAGHIVVAGSSGANIAFVRYTNNGQLDTTFGTGGITIFRVGNKEIDRVGSIVFDSSGRIVAAVSAGFQKFRSDYDIAVVRLNNDGTLDNSFGTGGKVVTAIGADNDDNYAQSLVIDSDGKIVVVGLSESLGDYANVTLARYNTDGSLDTSFGTGGIVMTDVSGTTESDSARDVVLDKNGRIVITGSIDRVIGTSVETDLLVARFNNDGSLDTSFGTGGKVVTDFGFDYADFGEAILLDNLERIIVAGSTGSSSSGIGLARYNP